MMHKITIPSQPPRVLQHYAPVKIFRGLAAYFGFGIFILTAVLFLIVTFVLSHGSEIESESFIKIIIPLVIFDAIGALLLMYGIREKQRRYMAFTRGIFVKGTVRGSGQKFVFWKSSRISTVTIEVMLSSGKSIKQILNLYASEIQQELFSGKEIDGLFDEKSGSLFFPQEIGVDISAE
jgi:hypothetical protein